VSSATTKHTSFHDLPRSAVIATMAGLMLALLIATLDSTIVATAMPRIVAELHGFEHYSGVVTAYLVASTAALPIAGKLSDLYGRKLFLVGSVFWFVAASALCGMSHSMFQLVMFRGLQGVGAGVLQAMAFTTIADLYPPAERGRVIGWVVSVYALGSVVGPFIGGVLTDGPGWRWVFYVNLPVGAIALIILFFYFPHIRPVIHGKTKIDYLGSVMLIAWVVPILLALSWGGRDYPWRSPMIYSLSGAGMLCLAIFLVVEIRASEPVLPVKLFLNPIVSNAIVVAALISAGLFGATLFIPLFVQTVIGKTATQSGTILTPLTMAVVVTALISGQLITKLGRYRPMAISGTAVMTVGMYMLSRLGLQSSYAEVIRDSVIAGLGMGIASPVFNLTIQNAVDIRLVGAATSLVQFMRSIGAALGVAIFGSIVTNNFVPAFHQAIPRQTAALLPAWVLANLDNPQIYMSPDAAKAIDARFSAFGPQGHAVWLTLQSAARTGLAVSIQRVFLAATFVMIAATLIVLFLREIPLRKSNRPQEQAKLEVQELSEIV
jgi:EmrB/QacA subfamily drug resistance transporter